MKIYDVDQIKKVINLDLSLKELINSQRQAFIDFSSGLYDVPIPMQLSFQEKVGDCHIKAGFKRNDDTFIIKVATGFYQNTKLGLPASDGVVLVFSQDTGLLQVVLCDGGILTTFRTSLAAAVAAQITPWDIKCIGVIGTGQLASQVIEIMRRMYPNAHLILWGRSFEKTCALANKAENVEIGLSIQDLVRKSELVITTTASDKAIINNGHVIGRKHIIALGADDIHKRECAADFFGAADTVITDSCVQALKFGDTFHAIQEGVITIDKVVELGNILQKKIELDAKLIVTDLTGIATQDVAITNFIIQKLNGN